MKGESFFSPLNFSPSYHQDNQSRLKLRGYREIANPLVKSQNQTRSTSNIPIMPNNYRNNIPMESYNNVNNIKQINNISTNNIKSPINQKNYEINNLPQYSPLQKTANNILDLNKKPNYTDQQKYNYVDYNNENNNNNNNNNKYMPNDNQIDNRQNGYNGNDYDEPNQNDYSNKYCPYPDVDNFIKTRKYEAPKYDVPVQNVSNFTVQKESKQYNQQSYQLDPSDKWGYIQAASANTNRIPIQLSKSYSKPNTNITSKNETFAHSIDQNNKNMSHLLRKY